ncbi:hypothetical protein BD311DRAFT_367877 [Dichomitus squalens]|uniref:Uncharacterized protein n=1 Tax=Dichomitus squalens TaxID=114155 RepID=A0A4V2K055_9APHY|nr:hypothetical protein BD311DRAFT_367877 [Dichomitus squalens]
MILYVAVKHSIDIDDDNNKISVWHSLLLRNQRRTLRFHLRRSHGRRIRILHPIPFSTPAQVVQALTDILPWRERSKLGDNHAHTTPLASLSAFRTGLRKPGQTLGERTVVSVSLLSPRIPRGQRTFRCLVTRT